MNAKGWGIPNDGVQSDNGYGSYVGKPDAGGLAAEAADYNDLLLLGPADPGYFESPSQMPGAVIEPLYLTDTFEGSVADSAEGHTVIARGIATAVEQFLAPPPRPRPAHATHADDRLTNAAAYWVAMPTRAFGRRHLAAGPPDVDDHPAQRPGGDLAAADHAGSMAEPRW